MREPEVHAQGQLEKSNKKRRYIVLGVVVGFLLLLLCTPVMIGIWYFTGLGGKYASARDLSVQTEKIKAKVNEEFEFLVIISNHGKARAVIESIEFYHRKIGTNKIQLLEIDPEPLRQEFVYSDEEPSKRDGVAIDYKELIINPGKSREITITAKVVESGSYAVEVLVWPKGFLGEITGAFYGPAATIWRFTVEE